MSRRTWIARAVASMLIAGLIAGCGGDTGQKLAEDEPLTIGQVVPTLGFITLDTARALDTFADEGIQVKNVQLSGGDPTALAALDAGDIDVAAVGSDAAVSAIAKGAGEYQIIYALMPKMSLELTVSDVLLERTGVTPDAPLEEKIQALKGARIGVSALGGAQERVSQWLAKQGGLDPATDLEIVNVGPPSALQAGMENKTIDAFLLTAPSGATTEASGYGNILIELGSEIPELRDYYHLVLVASNEFAANNHETLVAAARALNQANQAVVEDPARVTSALREASYGEVPEEIMTNSVEKLGSGLDVNGALTREGMQFLLEFSAETVDPAAEKLDVTQGEGEWWTNEFAEEADQG